MVTKEEGTPAGLALHRLSFQAHLYSRCWSELAGGAPEMGV